MSDMDGQSRYLSQGLATGSCAVKIHFQYDWSNFSKLRIVAIPIET
jgi:hypothetical protein